MKRYRRYELIAMTLAILLACFILPSSALAAAGMGSDNHTDTDDYCLRAHDVTIGLSEFTSKTREELESDIVSASAFAFYIRDTASGTGNFESITSGYSIDFSALVEEESSSGYVVSVTLPAISMIMPSVITFRVFVEDDLPHPREVSYLFVSGSAEFPLPDGVFAQLPESESILSGEPVTPGAAFSSVRDGVGEWTFSGWSPESVTLSDSNVSFTGTWIWTALPVYTVSFEFVSGTSGRPLPNSVLAKLPASTTGIDGDIFTPQESFRSFHQVDGVWRFHGWNTESQTVAGGSLTFIGEWRWHSVSVVVEPTPSATVSPASTPTIAPTPVPTQASASPSQQPLIQVLEQTPSDPPTPAASNATGGIAKMGIAAGLAALVATQSLAVASDLKVLNWYRAKKAAVRRI